MFGAKYGQQGFSIFSIFLLFSFSGRVHVGGDWQSASDGQMIAQCSGDIPVALIGSLRRGNEIRDFLTAGAAGYLTYSLNAQALLAGLRMINLGEIFVPIDVLVQEDQITQTGRHWLTGRERDVLNGLLAGHSNKEIARAHGLSEVTIKHHLKSLRAKLGARNRTHAVCRAIELGIAEETLPAAS